MRNRVGLADDKVKEKMIKLQDSSFEDQKRLAAINKAIDRIHDDVFCGTQVPKNIIPREYTRNYRLDNLWKYNLPDGWRLLYFVINDEETVVAIIIDWMSHKEYERLFNYG